eukprot:TRINITY_DN6790_c0_g1_i1.p1 TRINITY_DN6790_c0_g1~~TRINITY_DN6790_c0_g1_i1.p1  ORF type:complete len:164 (+),score=24.37 TRINITY_DN6790_c0_g1_i1:158-649(+)
MKLLVCFFRRPPFRHTVLQQNHQTELKQSHEELQLALTALGEIKTECLRWRRQCEHTQDALKQKVLEAQRERSGHEYETRHRATQQVEVSQPTECRDTPSGSAAETEACQRLRRVAEEELLVEEGSARDDIVAVEQTERYPLQVLLVITNRRMQRVRSLRLLV